MGTHGFKLGITTWFWGGPWVQSYRAEEVVSAKSQGEGKEQVREGM